jgi:hypothetical protein
MNTITVWQVSNVLNLYEMYSYKKGCWGLFTVIQMYAMFRVVR